MSATGERRKIAVDFDGTIVENRFPEIGRERPFALRALRSLQEEGFTLILWTCRTGAELDAAVEFCRQGGVEFYSVNENFEGETYMGHCPRKVDADIYIDDRNVGGLPSWGEIYQQLTGKGGGTEALENKNQGAIKRLCNWLVGK